MEYTEDGGEGKGGTWYMRVGLSGQMGKEVAELRDGEVS